jgi:hypothetical protein
MITSLTLLIVIFGTATVFLSVFVAFSFYKQSRNLHGDGSKLSKSLAFQLIGEAILGLGTTVFALLAYMELLPKVPLFIQSMIRLFLFSATALTTIHLYIVTTRMEK